MEYHLKTLFLGLWPRPTWLDMMRAGGFSLGFGRNRQDLTWGWGGFDTDAFRSEVQTVRPQVCSSNSETPGLKFKQWHARSGAWMLRTQVCGLNTESPGLQLMKCRPGLSVFEPQTLVLSIWAPDLGSHCLNCRPGVALFKLQTRGLTVWTTDLGSQYLITDLRSQYLTCRPGYRSR